MKNASQWTPSKFVYHRSRLMASRDPKQVSISSRLIVDRVARLYDEHIKTHCSGRLVDLGCGNVPFYEAYKNDVEENICVDWPNTLHANPYLDCECDLTQPLPFRDGEFDTIVLSDVLEHIPVPEQFWREMSRILSPGGKLLMNVPFYYWLHEQPHDYYRYTEHALRRFAERAGFKVLVLETLGGTPEVLADILAKNFLVVPVAGGPLAMFVQALARLFGSSRFGKWVSKESGKRFPLGYFMVAEKIGSPKDV